MKWIITEDRVNDGAPITHTSTNTLVVGRVGQGPTIKTQHQMQEYCKGMEHEFRLLDDDNEIYFLGMCQGLDDADGDEAFEPLDAIGKPYGCTMLQYRKLGEIKWKDYD